MELSNGRLATGTRRSRAPGRRLIDLSRTRKGELGWAGAIASAAIVRATWASGGGVPKPVASGDPDGWVAPAGVMARSSRIGRMHSRRC